MYKSPINWFGGKYYMAKHIIELFPEHNTYVEGFGGAGHILFRKLPSEQEIYNDKHEMLYKLFKTIQNEEEKEKLLFVLQLTPYSREEFLSAKDYSNEKDEVEKIRKFFLTTIQSMNGLGESWAFSKTQSRRGMSQNVSKFLGYVDERIKKSSERLERVTIENLDIIEILNKYDGSDTFFYLDPPYLHSTRITKQAYKHEMPNEKHIEMIDELLKIQGKVILSGYDNKIYEKLVTNGWEKSVLGEYTKKSSTQANKKQSKGEEVIWKNF